MSSENSAGMYAECSASDDAWPAAAARAARESRAARWAQKPRVAVEGTDASRMRAVYLPIRVQSIVVKTLSKG